MSRANDLSGLLLLHSSRGSAKGLADLAERAKEAGTNNVAFVCLLLLRRVPECIDLLRDTGRTPEAAFMARTYMPRCVALFCMFRERMPNVPTVK